MDRERPGDGPGAPTRSRRLEDLLALAVALLAEERGVPLDDVREQLWPAQSAATDENVISLLPIKGVKARVGLSVPMIYRLMQRGTFPRPRKIGVKSLWRSDEVEAWILSRERRDSDRD